MVRGLQQAEVSGQLMLMLFFPEYHRKGDRSGFEQNLIFSEFPILKKNRTKFLVIKIYLTSLGQEFTVVVFALFFPFLKNP